MKTLKKSCFHNLILYFLTKEITSVHDWGAYFIEYVSECCFLWNNLYYVFWDSLVWMPLGSKLDSSVKVDVDFQNKTQSILQLKN